VRTGAQELLRALRTNLLTMTTPVGGTLLALVCDLSLVTTAEKLAVQQPFLAVVSPTACAVFVANLRVETHSGTIG